MSESTSYKERIIELLDNLNEVELQGLYLALSGPEEMNEEEVAVPDDRLITDLTVDEFEMLIYEIVQAATTEALMDFSMSELGEEEVEFMDDFFEAFQRFLEEGDFEEEALDGDFDEFDDK